MAGDENTSKFKLDLDSSEFITSANSAKESISKLSSLDGISSLISGLDQVSGAIGVVGAAAFAAKSVFDAVLDAERVKAVSNQFNVLAQNSGVFADKLKSGLVESSHGWVDQTTLMEAANRAMVGLETGVDKLPQLMDAARKATSVMGGDLISNFESMSQAVETGNVRQLRHLGIIIDQQKAYKDYAVSIGTTVDSLSLAGKQQAIMNAVLDQTNKKFQGQNDDIRAVTTVWMQLKSTIREVGEIFNIFIEKIAGSAIKSALTSIKNVATGFKETLLAAFGGGTEKVEAMENKLKTMREQLVQAEKEAKAATNFNDAQIAQNKVAALTESIKGYEAELNKTKTTDKEYLEQQKQSASQQQSLSAQTTQKSKIDLDAQRKQKAEFQKDVSSIDKQILQEEIKTMDSVDQATKLYNKKRLQETQQIEIQIAAIKAKASQGHLTQKQADEEIVRLNKLKDLRMAQDDRELAQMQKQALDNQVEESKNAFDGIGNAFAATAQKNKMAIADFGANGQQVVNSFASHSTSSLQAWGAGTQKAGDAAKGAFYGMMGDIATHYGEMLLMMSIWPPNPLGLAAGGALIALGGKLGAMASGGGSPSFSAGGAGGGFSNTSGSTTGGADIASGGLASTAQQTTKSGVSTQIIVQGSIFDTDAASRRITDLVRNSSDSTDFSIQRVGGGV